MPGRKVLMKEYKSFKRDVAKELKELKPDVTLFGSYLTKKKRPNDIDVQIDVGYLSDKEFRKTRSKVGKIRRRYRYVDPVLYSWGHKRPARKKRKQIRWKGDWSSYEQI